MSEALFTDEAPPLVLDRSTAERWSDCPLQGWLCDGGVNTSSAAAESGQAVHDIIAAAVKARRIGGARPYELRDLMKELAAKSRPDLQPDVLDALNGGSIFKIVQLLTTHRETGAERHPDDILRFQSGDGDLSGQIAADLLIDGQNIRCTCELDLLMATDSPELVSYLDWKSGRSVFNATIVKASFQLGCWYPWLIFRNYPTVQRVGVRVMMPRKCEETDLVVIDRSKFYELEQRIISAVRIWLKYRGAGQAEVEAWPAPDKCSICPAVLRCTPAHEPTASEARDKGKLIHRLVVLEAQADAVKGILKGIVDEEGDIIIDGDPPIAFGREKPAGRTTKAKSCSIYEPAKGTNGNETLGDMGNNGNSKGQGQRKDMAMAGYARKPEGRGGDGESVRVGTGGVGGDTPDQATALRRIASEAEQRPVEVSPITAEQEREVNRICLLSWHEFTPAWQALLGTGISGTDFHAGMMRAVDRAGKVGRESSISKQTRKKWVVASLCGKFNWMKGTI